MTEIVKKIPPRVDDRDLQRALEQIYNDLNELAAQIAYRTGADKEQSGNIGDIRIIKDNSNMYSLAIKSGEGWVVSATSTFIFKDKL